MDSQALKIDPYKIDYVSITILAGKIDGAKFDKDNILAFVSEFEVENKVDFETKEIVITLETKIYLIMKDGEQFPTEATYTIENCFIVKNLDEFLVVEKEKGFSIYGTLGQTLIGIIYSTARGIIYGRLQGTAYDGYIMPIIAPKDFLNHGKMKHIYNLEGKNGQRKVTKK